MLIPTYQRIGNYTHQGFIYIPNCSSKNEEFNESTAAAAVALMTVLLVIVLWIFYREGRK